MLHRILFLCFSVLSYDPKTAMEAKMVRFLIPVLFPFLLVATSSMGLVSMAQETTVQIMLCPQGGLQPQAVVDADEGVHMIYLVGKPDQANIMYVYRSRTKQEFSKPLRVNSQDGCATAMGTIRGAQLAIGSNNRPHVAWNGNGKAQPRPSKGSPMLYTRLKDDKSGFEPQRNVITWAPGIDGGGSIAADEKGHVYVAWHANHKAKSEAERKLYVARSQDDGKTFAKEVRANSKQTGACACCGMKAAVDADGKLFMLYRAAKRGKERSIMLVTSKNGKKFKTQELHPWPVKYCVMSSASMVARKKSMLLAWETQGQIYMASMKSGASKIGRPVSAPGQGKGSRKHPAVVTNKKGEVLLIWTEGTGWNRGGTAHWQLHDKSLKVIGVPGGPKKVPTWSFATGFGLPDGSFVLVH